MSLASSRLGNPRTVGGALCAAGFVAIVVPARFAPALGAELIAAGFWWWARASAEPARQVPRWSWLRRPAAALWLAAALQAAMALAGGESARTAATLALGTAIAAVAVVWAALELLAALPLARPFSDLPAPFADRGFWLPALLPSAGFLLLWRQAPLWLDVGYVRVGALFLLLLTATLAGLRAFGRRQWTAGLRWLVVLDGALAGALLASQIVSPGVAALLWIGAGGTHTYLLAAELEGATPRRGPVLAALWRATAWTSTTALGWPLLAAVGSLPLARAITVSVLGGLPVALASWVNVARMVEAPERRSMARPTSGLTLTRVAPALLISGLPVAIVSAWWAGFVPPWGAMLWATVPALVGGGAALLTFRDRAGTEPRGPEALESDAVPRAGQAARFAARWLFRLIVGLERALVWGAAGVLRFLGAPLRDLHTGDAQEYVLFLAGVAVLAAVLPLLR